MVARKDKWSFEELMGSMVVGDKIGLDVVLTSGLFSVIRVNLPFLMKLPRRRFWRVELLSETLSLGRKGEFRESLSLHLLFFKCL